MTAIRRVRTGASTGRARAGALTALVVAAVLASQPTGAPARGDREPIAASTAVAASTAAVGASTAVGAASTLEAGAPGFDPPTADGSFGEPLTFRTGVRAAERPRRVELVTALPGESTRHVTVAAVTAAGAGAWEAAVVLDGHVVPNTRYRYHFRAVTDEGVVTGPEAEHRVRDDRVDWRSISGHRVRLWWHEGDESFAERALEVAEEALASATATLGTDVMAPVDVFVYGDARTFRSAMGPGTRENVGGQAHPSIRTLFGLIEPSQVGSDWVAELVRHELTHLAFDDAVANPYAYPPRWLNEGLAVVLSRGYGQADRAEVEGAARSGTLIPLEGLAGQFPTRPRRFSLAYAESASAVAHLMDRYGQEALGTLAAAYREGRGTDEAFRRATGSDVAGFASGWLEALGAEPVPPIGPRPAPPGPVPEAWQGLPAPLIR